MSADPPGTGQPASAGSGANGEGTPGASGAGTPGADGQPKLTGPKLARAALDAARAAGRTPSTRKRRDPDGPRKRGYSGPGPDPRDPQPFGRLIRNMVEDRGWEKNTAEATVLGSWDRVVGPEIASHCRPVGLREGELTLQAESTAWATQLRMLTPKILGRIAGELGKNVVTKIRVHGPAAPSWKKGPRSVPGRGPRDTYG